jgi:hypothetical protein
MIAARRRSAISLAELAAIVGATFIVGAVGYSAYRTYRVQREVTEGLVMASALVPAVTELFRRHQEVPAAIDVAPWLAGATSSAVVESVTVVDGRIDVLYGARADRAIAGRRISLTPYETVARQVVWLCGNRIPDDGLKPLGFAGGGRQAVRLPTTIEPRYLTKPCR